jgi:3',5'-cyclic AMP phosphodiesterase CpdA
VPPVRALHLSDLHFGWPADLEQVDAVEALIAAERYDVVAISGDLGQRARAGEFQRAAVLLRQARAVSRTITVPGNHDIAWWFAPLGIGSLERTTEKYRRYISEELEPVLEVPGATFVGLNTAHGFTWRTLTWNPHDIGVMGALRPAQLRHAADEFRRGGAGDARVIVMHHNPMRGEISRRYGLNGAEDLLEAFADMGVDLVLCGHDHQEAVHRVTRNGRAFTVIVAGTLSSRSRAGRPGAVHEVAISAGSMRITPRIWSPASRTFLESEVVTFPR